MSPGASATAGSALASQAAAALARAAPAAACASLAAAADLVWVAAGRLAAGGKSTITLCGVNAVAPSTAIAAPGAAVAAIAAPGAAVAADPLAADSAAAELTTGRLLVALPSGVAAALPGGV